MTVVSLLRDFLRLRDISLLEDTVFDVIFKFIRGELTRLNLWKYVCVAKNLLDKFDVTLPDSVDGQVGKTEREVAEKLLAVVEADVGLQQKDFFGRDRVDGATFEADESRIFQDLDYLECDGENHEVHTALNTLNALVSLEEDNVDFVKDITYKRLEEGREVWSTKHCEVILEEDAVVKICMRKL